MHPPLPLDTVNERPVRILLECILVFHELLESLPQPFCWVLIVTGIWDRISVVLWKVRLYLFQAAIITQFGHNVIIIISKANNSNSVPVLVPVSHFPSLYGYIENKNAFQSLFTIGGSLSGRGSLSGGLCPGVLHQGVSVQGVSIKGVSDRRGLCLGGSLSGGSLSEGYLSGEEGYLSGTPPPHEQNDGQI